MKSPTTKLQKECDALLQELNHKLHKNCEACGGPNQVGHHWIEKSRSNNLRYNLKLNLIALCLPCHAKIHNIFGNSIVGGLNVAEAIIKRRGRAWKSRVEIEGRKLIKVNVAYYLKVKTRLEKELANLI